ncbi:MAG TPA: isocitrate lyase/phosphoenolpyruvate mutase family protein, partial [Nitrospirales bacterium]|nr:isocitrate lyase/phosphoenolpyruvate mutase family protein [Nitrospirales bacterium]
DALSAKMIERAGFDAIWASGFGISASLKCIPDGSFLTMTEQLAVTQNIVEAVEIPVIADCDTGFGNALNVMRTVQDYEKAGIAGICIEDNVFPKRCSFYAGVRRELVSADEHAGKVRAAKSAQSSSDFVVIARTEALIAGWGQDEALKRAEAYADAGADAVLIHSKASTFDELRAVSQRWSGRVPLVVVPTIFGAVTTEELERHGFKIVIFANQVIRTAIKAMRDTLDVLKRENRAEAVSDRMVELQEVYDLVGVTQMEEDERRFLPMGTEKITAIIPAAGFEKQLLPLIQDKPKCLLDIKGKTILERQVAALNDVNIKDIVVIRGYQKDKIALPNLRYYDNDRYEETGELASIFCAERELKGRCLLLYSDIIFETGILQKLLKSPADITVVIDQAWVDHHRQKLPRPHFKPDLVMLNQPPATGYRFVPPDVLSRLVKIGQHGDPDQAHGEFIGLAMFSERGIDLLRSVYKTIAANPSAPLHEAPSVAKASLTDMLQELVNRGHEVSCLTIYKGWMEVDTFEDYQQAWADLKK